jgi:hypothetical protein
MTINKVREWFDDSYDLYINQICFKLMFITASMTRYQRTFEQQMKKRQIRVKNMLMKRIKCVIDVNSTTFDTSMQIVHDLYCTDVDCFRRNQSMKNRHYKWKMIISFLFFFYCEWLMFSNLIRIVNEWFSINYFDDFDKFNSIFDHSFSF